MNNSQFNIHIKDYRAIAEADIDINGITVLSGVNGCGKSSISMLTYEFFKSSINIEALMHNKTLQLFGEPLVLIDEFLNTIIKELKQNKALEIRNNISIFFEEWNRNSISISDIKIKLIQIISETKQLYVDNKNSIKSNTELNPQLSRTSRLIANYLPDYYKESDFEEVLLNLWEYIYKETTELDTQGSNFSSSIISTKLRNIYDSSTLPSVFEIKEYGLPLYSYPYSNRTIKVKSIKKIFYIDSPLILEADIDCLPNNNHWRDLRDDLKNSSKHDFNIEIEDLFHKNLSIQNIEHIVTFEESFSYVRTDGNKFNLFESATGIKSFAIIKLLYQNGLLNKNTLLLLDEPEIHLHPQWVVEYARLVVLLNKHLGVKFLIASHHPEFVSSIKYISEKEKTTERLNFYIAQEQKKFSYKFESTGIEIDETFISFNKSFDLIDKYGDNEI